MIKHLMLGLFTAFLLIADSRSVDNPCIQPKLVATNIICSCPSRDQPSDRNHGVAHCDIRDSFEEMPAFEQSDQRQYRVTFVGGRIKRIQKNALIDIDVAALAFDRVSIGRIDDDALSVHGGLLTELTFVDNGFGHFRPTTFGGLYLLRKLNISSNDLSTLDASTVRPPASVNELVLRRDNLTSIGRPRSFADRVGLVELDLSGNLIRRLPSDALAGLVSLRHLRLDANRLEDVANDSIPDSRYLKSISLSGNRLATLPESLFRRVPIVETIDLRDNRLSGVSSELLRGLGYLRSLHLENNLIARIDPGAFGDLIRLREVYLSDNPIGTLGEHLFANNTILDTIEAVNCSLMATDAGTFRGLSRVRKIDLSDNPLSTIPDDLLANLTTLETFVLRKSELDFDESASGLFRSMANMKWLLLDQNKITRIPRDLFRGARHVDNIVLRNNALSVIHRGAFDHLENTRTLDLSGNRIETLDPGLFASMLRLSHLDIGNNRIKELADGLFAGNPDLRSLTLNHNRLTALRTNVVSGLSKLEQLSMSDNDIRRIEDGALSGADGLVRIDFAGNRIRLLGRGALDGGPFRRLRHVNFVNNGMVVVEDGSLASLGARGLLGNFSDNELTRLSARMFGDQDVAQSFDFRRNRISCVSADVGERVLERKLRLYLAENLLRCDCSLSWVGIVAGACTPSIEACFADIPFCWNSPYHTIFNYSYGSCQRVDKECPVTSGAGSPKFAKLFISFVVVLQTFSLDAAWHQLMALKLNSLE